MTDTRQILQRALEEVEPPPDEYGRFIQRSRRRERRSRLLATAVAVMVAAAGIGVAAVTFQKVQRPSRPVADPQLEFHQLQLAWTARRDLGRFPPVDVAVQTATKLIIGTEQGLIAFDKECGSGGESCEPAWVAEFPPGDAHPAPALAHGVIYQAGSEGVYAFDPNCATEGQACSPLWIGRVPESLGRAFEVRVVDDVVIATVSRGDNPGQEVTAVAFRTGCASGGGSCEPAWTGVMGTGTVYSPGAIVGDSFYQQIGSRLVGFEAHCGDHGASCQPSFVFPTGGGDVYGPVRAGDEIVVASSDGFVYAFPAGCVGDSCRPLWRGETRGYMEGDPVAAGDVVTVTRGSSVFAFPTGCRDDGGACEPLWHFDAGGNSHPLVQYGDPEVVVAADWQRGRIWALPSDCVGSCQPAWEVSTGGEARSVEVVEDFVFLETGAGSLMAYPLNCKGECEPIWSADVEGRLVTDLLLDGEGIYTLSVHDIVIGETTVTAFREQEGG